MSFQSKGIVLRTVDYGESDRILSILTEQQGKVAVFVPGARRSKRRYAQALDIGCEMSGEFIKRRRTNLLRLGDFSFVDVRLKMRANLGAILRCMVLFEAVQKLTPEWDPQPKLYQQIEAAVEQMSRMPKTMHDISLAVHLFRLLKTLGFLGSLTECNSCEKTINSKLTYSFSPIDGSLICSRCQPKTTPSKGMQAGTLKSLNQALASRIPLSRLRLSAKATTELHRAACDLIEFHSGSEMKSRHLYTLIAQDGRKQDAKNEPPTTPNIDDLAEVMRILRSDNGCPWDREQTHATLLPHLIEEAYEVMEAVQKNDLQQLRDELGDLLLHVVFHAQLAKESNSFTLADVIAAIHNKLIHRHPHVFGDKQDVKDADDVKKVWSEQKRKEGKKTTLGGIPTAMPAIQRAWRLSDKASTVGFDWPNIEAVWNKYTEELGELKEAIQADHQEQIIDEFGDLLFCLVNISRYLKIDPETALQRTNNRFVERFTTMERLAAERGKELSKLTHQDLEKLWQEAKQK